MRFKPKTQEELDSMNLFKAGIYSFKVTNAQDQTSKSGNEMLKITLEIYDDMGNIHHLFDYLLEAMAHKLHSFCKSVGLLELYKNGALHSNDCIGKCGLVEIGIEKGKENPQGGFYADKNAVKKYLDEKSRQTSTPSTQSSKTESGFDDDLPF